jgi:hypothetical protein
VLAPVHDANDDRARSGGNLDEIQTGFRGGLASLVEGNDADLLSGGTDEADGAETDLLVDADVVVDADGPPCQGSTPRKNTGNITSSLPGAKPSARADRGA